MSDRVLSFVAFAFLAAFLAILVYKVPRLDLAAIVVITLLFVVWDFFLGNRDDGERH